MGLKSMLGKAFEWSKRKIKERDIDIKAAQTDRVSKGQGSSYDNLDVVNDLRKRGYRFNSKQGLQDALKDYRTPKWRQGK